IYSNYRSRWIHLLALSASGGQVSMLRKLIVKPCDICYTVYGFCNQEEKVFSPMKIPGTKMERKANPQITSLLHKSFFQQVSHIEGQKSGNTSKGQGFQDSDKHILFGYNTFQTTHEA